RMGSGNASRYYTESAGETAAAGDTGKVPVRDFRGRQPRLEGALEQDIAPGVDDLRVGVRHQLLPGGSTRLDLPGQDDVALGAVDRQLGRHTQGQTGEADRQLDQQCGQR